MAGELDGSRFELRRDGRSRFTLVTSGAVLATAETTARGRWTISVDGSAYQLRRTSRWRSPMELRRNEIAVGSIRRGRRGQVLCDFPAELSPAVQAFIGFVVVALWNRAAASSGSAVVVAGG
jgi:hypothetical protein